jgi:indole-3-glycerol phosphate synthase
MPFIDEILKQTDIEISRAKKDRSIGDLKRMIRDAPPLRSFHSALSNGFGLIAEIKKRSPSAGEMRSENFETAPTAYAKSPIVKAVSVLTNSSHFGMGIDHLARVKPLVRKPVLRKDFIRKEYQIYEARAFGADAVLLMATFLDKDDLRRLFQLASELGMDVLFEAHTKEEIDSIPDGARIYGINSRRFMATKRWWFTKLFVRVGLGKSSKAPDPSVELNTFSLIRDLPKNAVKIAESGVKPNRISDIVAMGYDAVLVGTSILKAPEGVEATLDEFERGIRPMRSHAASVESLLPA